jgi:hypothetical protein
MHLKHDYMTLFEKFNKDDINVHGNLNFVQYFHNSPTEKSNSRSCQIMQYDYLK